MDKTDLANRMKGNYENRSKTYLMRRNPVCLRLDGKAFHTFAKGLNKPFDDLLIETMQDTTKYLCENIQGCKLGYTQSDEISLLLTDYEKLTTDAWFDYGVQKIVSVSASMATLAFNRIFEENSEGIREERFSKIRQIPEDEFQYLQLLSNKYNKALFDSRAFSIPKEEVANYFIWRQQDCTKNSVSMLAQSQFSHKQLQNKNDSAMQDMLILEKGINWNDLETFKKRGSCVKKEEFEIFDATGKPKGITRGKWVIDKEIPIFSKNREYIENNV